MTAPPFVDPPWTCGACAFRMTRCTPVDGGGPPGPGDLAVCLQCGCLHQRAPSGVWRVAPAACFVRLPASVQADIVRVQAARVWALYGPGTGGAHGRL